MIGFPLALLMANGFEWVAHKYVLHGTPRPGQERLSPLPAQMRSHWAHHKAVRLDGFVDTAYEEGLPHERVYLEARALVATAGAFTLLAPVAPFFVAGVWYSAGHYFWVHRKAHLNPNWARQHIPWHVDHHLNSDQDANWCVTKPWFDYLMGTRVIRDATHRERNPLALPLPAWAETRLNAWAKRLGRFRLAEQQRHPVALPDGEGTFTVRAVSAA